jgi:hypothetical protein
MSKGVHNGEYPMKHRRIPKITRLWLALAAVLLLSLLGHSFGYDIWQPPPGQPEQISSKVDYDPKLADRFFQSDRWLCPGGDPLPVTCRYGKPVLILSHPSDSLAPETSFDLEEWTCPDGCKECATCRDGEPVLRNTARCYSTSFGVKHPVNFCKARLIDGHVIELLFHKSTPAFRDFLRIRIRNGRFMSQYWIPDHGRAFKWTTTRQKLTLDRKEFRKGDVIKGRIDFECDMKLIDAKDIKKWRVDPTGIIKVSGAFKTIVE